MVLVPVGPVARAADTGQVWTFHAEPLGAERPAATVQAMTGEAVVLLEDGTSPAKLREIRDLQVRVASSTAGIGEDLWDHGPRPVLHVPVSVGCFRCPCLPAMANSAT